MQLELQLHKIDNPVRTLYTQRSNRSFTYRNNVLVREQRIPSEVLSRQDGQPLEVPIHSREYLCHLVRARVLGHNT